MTEVNESSLRCFVVGPIGNKFAEIGSNSRESYEQSLETFENVILPACRKYGIDPIRADQIAVSGEITDQIFRHLYEDEIVIADVSGGNPNVMYELGLRHTRPGLTIQIGEYGQLPFDINAVRTIQFSRSERGLIDARKSLELALEYGLAGDIDPLTATRIWNPVAVIAGIAGPVEVRDDAGPDGHLLEDEDGLLERIAAIEERLPRLTETAERIGAVVVEMGHVAETSNAEISVANASGMDAKGRLTVIAKFGGKLQAPADELTVETNAFYRDMADLDEQVAGIIGLAAKHPELIKDGEIDPFLNSILGMSKTSREAMENLNQFGAIVEGLGGLSRVLRRPTKQVGDSVRTMAKAITLTETWESEVRKLRLGRVQ